MKNSNSLYLEYDDSFLNEPSKVGGYYHLDLRLVESNTEFGGHLSKLYFEKLSQPKKFKSEQQLLKTTWLVEKYIDFFGSFKSEKYWLSDEGKIKTFDLSREFNQIFIVKDSSGVKLQTLVRQVDILFD